MRDIPEMRAAYCDALMALAEKDDRVIAVHADLMASHSMKPFAAKYPSRSLNVGIAEANMVGVAAGLAAAGKLPFVHTFAAFASRRCYDQIAISVCYARLKVCIIGSDPGVGAELNGGTHMAFEDVALMRVLPGMTVFEPADATQLTAALPALAAQEGPVYIRFCRKTMPPVVPAGYTFVPGAADTLHDGTDVTVIASGICVHEALAAAKNLAAVGISARVVNMHTIKPLDAATILRAAAETGAIVTAENHNIIGGLGSAVAELLAEERPTPLVRVGVRDRFGEVGKRDYLMQTFGLTASHIAEAVNKVLKRKA